MNFIILRTSNCRWKVCIRVAGLEYRFYSKSLTYKKAKELADDLNRVNPLSDKELFYMKGN